MVESSRPTHAGNWHPLTWMSHMLDGQSTAFTTYVSAVPASPERWKGPEAGGHHMTSVLLHAAAAIVLFLALRRMTGAFWCSALVAAMFALHPLQVESVAWVAERKDVLSGLFWMLTLLAYGGYVLRPSIGRYLAVVAVFALGLDGQVDAGDVALRSAAAGLLAAAAMAAEAALSRVGGTIAFPFCAAVARMACGGETAAVGLVGRRLRAIVAMIQQEHGLHEHDRTTCRWRLPHRQRGVFRRRLSLEDDLAVQSGDLLSASGGHGTTRTTAANVTS